MNTTTHNRPAPWISLAKRWRRLPTTNATASALLAPAAAFLLNLLTTTTSSASITTVTTLSGLTISVNTTGAYTISATAPAWTFGGNVGVTLTSVASSTGSDSNGAYHQIAFNHTQGVARTSSIRAYDGKTAVLFTTQYLASGSNANPFPKLSSFPGGLYHVSYGNTFGIYNFSTLFNDSPWIYFDSSAQSFVLSPAKNFMIASDTSSGGTLSCGIDSAITTLPANFSHQTWLVLGQGINQTYDVWGNCMTNQSGKHRVANDASTTLNNLGYWTDHGTAYYYTSDSTLGLEGTLLAIRDEFKQKGIPLGYMQLDSWFYPKSSTADWTKINDGMYQYVAAPQLFPDGLPSFHASLGLPLVTHNRWIDPASPYRSQYAMSNNVSPDPAFWNNIIGYIHSAGVMTYEQDFLATLSLPNMNLNDPPNFMANMRAACVSNGLEMEYCMPLARHYLQSSLYDNLRTIRVSNDVFGNVWWDQFLYDSKLALSLGTYGWTDAAFSSQTKSLAIQALSCGPVGVGDALGAVNVPNVLACVRPDGVIVKPDSAIVPTDQTYIQDAQGLGTPMIAAGQSTHGSSAYYILSWARNSSSNLATFTPTSLGASGNVYLYNTTWDAGSYQGSGTSFSAPVDTAGSTRSATLFLAAPVGTSGIAFLGDLNKYASLGQKRISALSDNGTVSATVVFASGESAVTISGWSPTQPTVTASLGTVGSVTYNAQSGLFSVPVSQGTGAKAQISITRAAGTQTTLLCQAEGLGIAAATDPVTTFSDGALSNGSASLLSATAVGDLVSYTVNVPEARTYDVRVGTRKQSNEGMFQLAVAGSPNGTYTNHGAVQDEYNSSNLKSEFDIGTITFGSAGDKTFRFTVTGKNSASAGYALSFDYIKLIAQ